jgi:hypothetical protein
MSSSKILHFSNNSSSHVHNRRQCRCSPPSSTPKPCISTTDIDLFPDESKRLLNHTHKGDPPNHRSVQKNLFVPPPTILKPPTSIHTFAITNFLYLAPPKRITSAPNLQPPIHLMIPRYQQLKIVLKFYPLNWSSLRFQIVSCSVNQISLIMWKIISPSILLLSDFNHSNSIQIVIKISFSFRGTKVLVWAKFVKV